MERGPRARYREGGMQTDFEQEVEVEQAPQVVEPQVSASEDKDQVINVLRRQNNKLRTEMKAMNDRLNEVLARSKTKEKPAAPAETPENVLVKELDNAQRQIAGYKKEIASLKARGDSKSSLETIPRLENQLRAKDKEIESLMTENRTLEKIKLQQEKTIEKLSSESEHQKNMTMLLEDLKAAREKNRSLQEKSRAEEKRMKKQQEFLVVLETQYREVCAKFGVAPTLNYSKMDESMQKTPGNVSTLTAPDQRATLELPRAKETIDEPNSSTLQQSRSPDSANPELRKLKERNDILVKSGLSIEKRYRLEMEKLKATVVQGEAENKTLADKLKEKEKEVNILTSRLNEMSRHVKMKLKLEPIPSEALEEEVIAEDLKPSPSQPDRLALKVAKDSRVLLNKMSQDIGSTSKRMKNGKEGQLEDILDNLLVVTDQKLFPFQFEVRRLTKVTAYFSGRGAIFGIAATYQSGDHKIVESNPVVSLMGSRPQFHFQNLDIEEGDQVSVIMWALKANTLIGYLKVETLGGKLLEVGDKLLSRDRFYIHIPPGCHPVSLWQTFVKNPSADEWLLYSIAADVNPVTKSPSKAKQTKEVANDAL